MNMTGSTICADICHQTENTAPHGRNATVFSPQSVIFSISVYEIYGKTAPFKSNLCGAVFKLYILIYLFVIF